MVCASRPAKFGVCGGRKERKEEEVRRLYEYSNLTNGRRRWGEREGQPRVVVVQRNNDDAAPALLATRLNAVHDERGDGWRQGGARVGPFLHNDHDAGGVVSDHLSKPGQVLIEPGDHHLRSGDCACGGVESGEKNCRSKLVGA